LDNAATTRCSAESAELALQLMVRDYGNPSSLHGKGLSAQLLMEQARERLAAALGCLPGEVLFTHGGTESNNLAILGAAAALRRRGDKIVAMSTCHSSVLAPLKHLEGQGCSVALVNPLPDGNPDPDALANAVDGGTILLCLELVGGEVGAITPVAELCRRVRRKNKEVFIHCDAVQALGKVPFAAARLGVDALSVSAHKIHAPKGCGALYLRKGARILPLLHGGGQERGLCPGTQSVPLICAFGLAAARAVERREAHLAHVDALREYFVNNCGQLPGLCINSPRDSTPYISNISLPGFRSETMLHFLAERGIYVSSGSACAKGAASHVLKAMGLPAPRVDSALRISLCPENTAEELDLFFKALREGTTTLARSGA